jgi:signal transduction histidine kinase
MTGETEDPVRRLRHDLANPLSALLAETQLLLLNPEQLTTETLNSLKEIERLARRMRDMLHATKT